MPGRIEKTVFISYRRTNLPWALFIWQNLTMHGYDVFFDYQSIDSGGFEKIILENIRSRAHFIVILTPSALERCKDPSDWLRREIETAIDEKRNIVPLMMEGFDFGSPLVKQVLTGKLSILSGINGLPVPDAYAVEAMNRLRERFLTISLHDVNLPVLEAEAKEATEIQQSAANEAPPVTEEQLTAQTWFERGYVFAAEAKNFDEAIRCFTEAIKLEPNFIAAYIMRGDSLARKGNRAKSKADYNKVIRLTDTEDTADAHAFYGFRGIAQQRRGNLKEAIDDFTKSINADPEDAAVYSFRADILLQINELDRALADYNKTTQIDKNHSHAYYSQATIYEKKKNYSAAILNYKKYLELVDEIHDDTKTEVEKKLRYLKSKLTQKNSQKKKPLGKNTKRKGVGS